MGVCDTRLWVGRILFLRRVGALDSIKLLTIGFQEWMEFVPYLLLQSVIRACCNTCFYICSTMSMMPAFSKYSHL